jgi:hypothetical protein
MRRFESEEQYAALRVAVYQDPLYEVKFRAYIEELLDKPRMVVTRLEATPQSKVR